MTVVAEDITARILCHIVAILAENSIIRIRYFIVATNIVAVAVNDSGVLDKGSAAIHIHPAAAGGDIAKDEGMKIIDASGDGKGSIVSYIYPAAVTGGGILIDVSPT
jgi:hypothetical protein